MKIQRSIFLFCGGIIVLLALVVWLSQRTKTNKPPQASSAVVTNTFVAAQTTEAQSSTRTTPTEAVSVPNNAPKSKEQQMLETLSTENDVPIVFYGKLEDQFGNPVAGAEVTGNTIIRNGLTEGGGRITTTSDSNGFFKIDAGKGESLGVGPHKEGYVLAVPVTEYKYSHL